MAYKVLVTSLLAGMGHIMAKRDFLETLQGKGDEIEIFEYDSKVKIYDSIYRLLIRFPKLYGQLYANQDYLSRLPENVLYKLEKKFIKKILDKDEIDAVITTHPFHNTVFEKLRRNYGYRYKIINIVCDYGDQPGYLVPSINYDYALVRDEWSREINSKYFDKEKIFLFGTGIKHIFAECASKTKDEINFEFQKIAKSIWQKEIDNNKKNILFIGGSGRARASKGLISRLSKTGEYNILVSCGKDEEFFELIKDKKNVYAFGFIEQKHLAIIENFVDISILSAFAPSSMNEFLAIGKYPLFVHKIIGPQEAQNIKILDIYKLGIYQPDQKKMIETIKDYLKYPYKYKKFMNNQKKFLGNLKAAAEKNYETVLKIVSSGNII